MDEAGEVRDPLAPLDAVTLVAMAVNEENRRGWARGDGADERRGRRGAGDRVLLPAPRFAWLSDAEKEAGLLRYFLLQQRSAFCTKRSQHQRRGGGLQGEVGVACSMAAGGLVAALNGE